MTAQSSKSNIGMAQALLRICSAASSRALVSGLTHKFYRYPARFSPLFARAAIEAFTSPGDFVLDPFMGGGTVLVEASALGRMAVGTDISSLAVFISNAKTTLYSERDLLCVKSHFEAVTDRMAMTSAPRPAIRWKKKGYLRNLNSKTTWRLRKLVEIALAELRRLPEAKQQMLGRCILLKTAQWAFDCRKVIPTVQQFRCQLNKNMEAMIRDARDYSVQVRVARAKAGSDLQLKTLCLQRSAAGLEAERKLFNIRVPKLILTSPPYPGVHVLYHRWQIQGRRETPAPFWIAGTLDGAGASYYNMGDRNQSRLTTFYENCTEAFRSLAAVSDQQTIMVQMVAFSEPSWQLPEYLTMLNRSGFVELRLDSIPASIDGRLWRSVPNRKWYAECRESKGAGSEVVLFHKLARHS